MRARKYGVRLDFGLNWSGLKRMGCRVFLDGRLDDQRKLVNRFFLDFFETCFSFARGCACTWVTRVPPVVNYRRKNRRDTTHPRRPGGVIFCERFP